MDKFSTVFGLSILLPLEAQEYYCVKICVYILIIPLSIIEFFIHSSISNYLPEVLLLSS